MWPLHLHRNIESHCYKLPDDVSLLLTSGVIIFLILQWCKYAHAGRQSPVVSFPIVLEGSTAPLLESPPLRPGCVGSRCGRRRGFSDKSWEPTARRAPLCQSAADQWRCSAWNRPVLRRVWGKNRGRKSSSMVVTDAPTKMSRTDEVHRITENVYKVRRLGLVVFIADTCCAEGLWSDSADRLSAHVLLLWKQKS